MGNNTMDIRGSDRVSLKIISETLPFSLMFNVLL
jgi:hypothetical protein